MLPVSLRRIQYAVNRQSGSIRKKVTNDLDFSASWTRAYFTPVEERNVEMAGNQIWKGELVNIQYVLGCTLSFDRSGSVQAVMISPNNSISIFFFGTMIDRE
jgi:hypothetical protein